MNLATKSHGEVLDCPRCGVPASQEHFLNVCPINTAPRVALQALLPSQIRVKHLHDGNIHAFYRESRSLEASIVGSLRHEELELEELATKLSQAASDIALTFTQNSMDSFKNVQGSNLQQTNAGGILTEEHPSSISSTFP